MRFLKSGIATLALIAAMPATAADISIYQRDLYDRLSIENVPQGQIVENTQRFTIPFSDSLSEEEKRALLTAARGLSAVSLDNDRLEFSFNTAVSDSRHFRIGNKIILDVFLNMDEVAALRSSSQSVPAPAPSPEQEAEARPAPELQEEEEVEAVQTSTPAPEPESVQELNETPPNEEPAAELKPVAADNEVKAEGQSNSEAQPNSLREVINEETPELSVAETLPALAGPSIVSVSSTSPFGLAVFQRRGRLFVVTDQSTMAIPPQISGDGADLGWEMKEIPIDQGKAWMMPIPEGAYLRPEGRGLIWRVVISDTDPDLESATLRRRLTGASNPEIDILMSDTSKLLRLRDPDYGDDLAIATVKRATSRMQNEYDFVGFDILPAVIGAVIKPEADGLRLEAAQQYVTISNSGGLVIAQEPQDEIVKSYLNDEREAMQDSGQRARTTLDRIFYFSDWGGGVRPQDFIDKRKDLDNFLALAQEDNKLSILLDLVRLTLSQGMGYETLGYLDIATDVNAQIEQAAEYQALRGAAHYLSHQYDLAKRYFESEELENISEARLWLAATEAALGNEKEAMKIYDDNAVLTSIYPYEIKQDVLAPLALAFLNQGRGQDALPFIDLLDQGYSRLSQEQRATLAYLKGRAQSVTGRPDEGISNLYRASTGDKLGPYGIRSELLLIQDELNRDVIGYDEAIRRMERLRFAWRGDALETEIQKKLGRLYIQNEQPRKGLSILKRAAANTDSANDRQDMVRDMAEAYKSIFLSDEFENLDPLIAVAVYDEFKELTPVGTEGNRLIDSLADKLMSINLMSRAANVLKDKMDRLGGGQNAIQSGLRIASIELLDREPENALATLEQVDSMIVTYQGDDKDEMNSRIVLLKAKALAEMGQPEQALFMTEGLDDTDDVIKLRIDTAWRSGQWVAVTDNLAKLLARQNMTSAQPPTAQQAQLILNQAVALSLSDQYDALQRFARQYDQMMKQTPFYKQFLVVSRPQNISNLADRETLLDVTSEVDLFDGVLEQTDGTAEPDTAPEE